MVDRGFDGRPFWQYHQDMRDIDKHSARQVKSRAYADFFQRVKETFTWFMTTPVSIFNCLTEAR